MARPEISVNIFCNLPSKRLREFFSLLSFQTETLATQAKFLDT